MALFKSGNPALHKETFDEFMHKDHKSPENPMTLQGTINKAFILLALLLVTALHTWNEYTSTHDIETMFLYVKIGSIGGLFLAFIIVFNKDWSPFLAPLYTALQGLCLGGLSAAMDQKFPGIVMQSLLMVTGIFISLMIIYKLGIIKVTENFKLIVASATIGVALYYLLDIGLSTFGHINLPLVNDNSYMGIAFSLFVVILASMNLVVDFDFIENGVKLKAPKYMEWYSAFGLMVTIIWLYLEILRLLAKSRSRGGK
jgi:uncharacterized YccA/Bax inhibitor family protein